MKKKSKAPFEVNWSKKTYSWGQIQEWVSKGNNYGVLSGYHNLQIIDVDSEEADQKLKGQLPKTFTVRSGGNGKYKRHYYYFVNGPVKEYAEKILRDEKGEPLKDEKGFEKTIRLVDVLGEGQQAVGPSSIHPDTGELYTVENDVDIRKLTKEEHQNIIDIVRGMHEKTERQRKKDNKTPQKQLAESDNFIEKCKDKIKIVDILKHMGIDTNKNPTECPFHSSKGGKCLGFDDETAHCFHCEGSWNIFTLVQDLENCHFGGALEFLAYNFGLQKELEESRQKYREKKENEKSIQINNEIIEQGEDNNNLIHDFPYEVITGLANEYVKLYTERSELSRVHMYMSLISILGSILSTNVYVKGMNKITPNLYTLILGESDSKKSSAIKNTCDFFDILDYNIIRGIGSGEGLLQYIKELGADEDKKQVLMYFDEFKSFIDKAKIENSSLSSHLCTLYESDKSENRTKKDITKVKKVYLSLLAACTYETYEDCWSSNFTAQGLSNRFLLVPGYSEKIVSLPLIDEDKKSQLQGKIKEIIDNIGIEHQIRIDCDAYKLYDRWYKELKNVDDIDTKKRIEWICIKISMIISLLDEKYAIDMDTIQKAIKICNWEMKVRSILKPIEADTLDSEIEGKIIKCLKDCKEPITDRIIEQKTKIRSRKGTSHYQRVRKHLIDAGIIVLVKKEKAHHNTRAKMWLGGRDIPEGYKAL